MRKVFILVTAVPPSKSTFAVGWPFCTLFYLTAVIILLPVANLAVSMFVLHKEGFIPQIDGKCDRRCSESGKKSLQSIPSAERAGVPPCLTNRRLKRVRHA